MPAFRRLGFKRLFRDALLTRNNKRAGTVNGLAQSFVSRMPCNRNAMQPSPSRSTTAPVLSRLSENALGKAAPVHGRAVQTARRVWPGHRKTRPVLKIRPVADKGKVNGRVRDQTVSIAERCSHAKTRARHGRLLLPILETGSQSCPAVIGAGLCSGRTDAVRQSQMSGAPYRRAQGSDEPG